MELKGKTINFLGDSITEGACLEDVAQDRYDHVLARLAGLKATRNYGIGGTRLAHQTVPSSKPRHDLCFCGRAYDLDPEADITVVYGGINDYLHGDAPFGSPEDRTPAPFCGGVNFLMDLLQELYPQQQLVFMTPARCCFYGMTDLLPSTFFEKPVKGERPSLDYVEAIQAAGKARGIPVLDLYHDLGIDPNLPEDRERYTADGLHFNDVGHGILARKLKDFLENL